MYRKMLFVCVRVIPSVRRSLLETPYKTKPKMFCRTMYVCSLMGFFVDYVDANKLWILKVDRLFGSFSYGHYQRKVPTPSCMKHWLTK